MRFLQRRWRTRVHVGSRAGGISAPSRACRARLAAGLCRAAPRPPPARARARAARRRGQDGRVVARFALSSLLARAGGATTRSGTATRAPCRCSTRALRDALHPCMHRCTRRCLPRPSNFTLQRSMCAGPPTHAMPGLQQASCDLLTNCYATSLHSPGRPGQSGPPLRRFITLSSSTACAGRCVRRCVRSRSRWCWTFTMRR